MSRKFSIVFGLALFASVTWSGACLGLQKDDAQLIKSAYQQMTELASESNWDKAAELMTRSATDEICGQMVVMAIGIRDMELPRSVSQIEEAQDQVESVLDDYGLNNVDIKVEMFRFGGAGDEEKPEDRRAKMEQNLKTVLTALEKIEDRWKLVSELQKAMSSMPFGHNPLLIGEVLDVQIENEAATVKIKPNPPQNNQQRGLVLQVVAPPRVVNYSKVDGKWLFAGLNREKTDEAFREFEKSQAAQPGGADF